MPLGRADPITMDFGEVQKHNTADSCWVLLYDQVYDVTDFLSNHPGGSKIILQLAGQDATEEYDPIHPPGTIEENLPPSSNLGTIDKSTLTPVERAPVSKTPLNSSSGLSGNDDSIPPSLDSLLNLDEIETAATKSIPRKVWAYYYSASDELHSKVLNTSAFRQVLLRPRIFRDVTRCDTSTTLFSSDPNTHVGVPFFVSPAAMARLAHPDGEVGIGTACRKFGAAQVISNNASMTPEQIVADAPTDQVFGWQLYVQTDRRRSEAMLARINKLPQFKYVVLTLDAPVPGKREEDERAKNIGANLPVKSAAQQAQDETVNKGKQDVGIGKSLFAGTAPDLTWSTTLPWLTSHTSLPIVLKGVQTHEDAYLAACFSSRFPQLRCIILSNHGGRALDTASPALHTLLEIRRYCPSVLSTIDIWLDGGIKRGTDVVKALCLGARGVGLGRAPLWGLGAGGREGVERVLTLLKEETETCMRLLGVEMISELGMQHVNTRSLERDIYDGPSTHVDEAAQLLQNEPCARDTRNLTKSKL